MSAEIRPATAAEWDSFYTGCPFATYSQSRAWAEDWSTYRRTLRPDPLLVIFGDARRALLPIVRQRRRRGLAHKYVLAAGGTYGGWLALEPLGTRNVAELGRLLRRARLPLWWRLNPFDAEAEALAGVVTEHDVTHVVPISQCEELQAAHRGHREAVRKARRAGLSVRRAAGPADWASYYDVYGTKLREWGDEAGITYDAALFEILRRRGSPGVELWLVELGDGTIIGGSLNLYSARHAAGWHMAMLSEHYKKKPANLLVSEMIDDARQRSFQWFDMNPSGGHEGAMRFKQNCGGQPLASPIVAAGGDLSTTVTVTYDLTRRVRAAARSLLRAGSFAS
jgi:hypothetical protein